MLLPLAGRRVLVTRSREQSSALAAELKRLGATVLRVPTIAIDPPSSYLALDDAITHASEPDWLLFTSANAVDAFAGRARSLNIQPLPHRLAAIGPATATALKVAGLFPAQPPVVLPAQAVAEAFAAALAPYIVHLMRSRGSARLTLVRAEHARDILPETLRQLGAHVSIASAYRNVLPAASAPLLARLLSEPRGRPHAITFTSSSTASHLAALLAASGQRLPPEINRISIGPITSQTLRDLDLPPHAEAIEATVPSLVQAVVQVLGST